MQGTKSLTFSMLDWGCQILHGTRECQKELFIKSSDTIQSMRQLNHFLVEAKILDNGWHPWSNWLAPLPSAPCRFLMLRFLMLRVNFRRIDFLLRKKIIIFQSIYKNTFIQLKKGMRTWRMQSSFHDRSCVKHVDCNIKSRWYNPLISFQGWTSNPYLQVHGTYLTHKFMLQLCNKNCNTHTRMLASLAMC